MEASFSSHSSLDSKIQLSLEELVGCSDRLVVLPVPNHYLLLNKVLIQARPLASSLSLLALRQALAVVSFNRLQNHKVPKLGCSSHSRPRQVEVSLRHQEVQVATRFLTKQEPDHLLLGPCSGLRPAHSSRVQGYSNNPNRLNSNQLVVCSLLLRMHLVVSRLKDRYLERVVKSIQVDNLKLLT